MLQRKYYNRKGQTSNGAVSHWVLCCCCCLNTQRIVDSYVYLTCNDIVQAELKSFHHDFWGNMQTRLAIPERALACSLFCLCRRDSDGVNAIVKREKNKWVLAQTCMHVELNQYRYDTSVAKTRRRENQRKRSNFSPSLLLLLLENMARTFELWLDWLCMRAHAQTHLPHYHIDYGNEGTI